MDDNQIGKNILALRKTFRETQMGLALAIGLSSPNTISNYEKGKRYPDPDIRKKIAAHYRITEDLLANSDLSQFELSEEILENNTYAAEMYKNMLPVVCTESAMKNNNFRTAFDLHQRAIEAINSGKEFAARDIEICMDNYKIAYDEGKLKEAAANMLWLFLQFEIGIKNPWIKDIGKGRRLSSDTAINLLKEHYLINMWSPDSLSSNVPPVNPETLEATILEIIKDLKSTSELSDLADYYLALRYIMNCVNNQKTEGMNRIIGSEMMSVFANMGNKYAKKYLRMLRKLL